MSIKVRGDKAFLINDCHRNVKVIYTIDDGFISLTNKFKVIYKAFWNIVPRIPGPKCASREYTIPNTPVTYLAGIKDKDSDYVLFKNLTSLTPETSITNEGIGLYPYLNSNGYSPYYKFEYEITNDPNEQAEVNIYSLLPGDDRIRLFVDTKNNLTSYIGKSNEFIAKRENLIFFRYTGPGIFNLKVTAIPPLEFGPCVLNENECIKIMHCNQKYSSILYSNVENEQGFYDKVPMKQWSDIFDLIREKWAGTSKPIPLGDIVPSSSGLKNVLSETDIKMVAQKFNVTDIYLPCVNATNNYTSAYKLWGVFLLGGVSWRPITKAQNRSDVECTTWWGLAMYPVDLNVPPFIWRQTTDKVKVNATIIIPKVDTLPSGTMNGVNISVLYYDTFSYNYPGIKPISISIDASKEAEVFVEFNVNNVTNVALFIAFTDHIQNPKYTMTLEYKGNV